MSNASALFRSLIVYGLCLPLAVALGYLLANPLDSTTVIVVGIILFILLIPPLLRWHHFWLIAGWNISAVIFFLPGHPSFWMPMTALSFLIAVLQYTINRNLKFLYVPSVTRPLLFIAAVVLITARLTGGIGLKALGSSVHGGKYYISILAAIVGYFALTSRQIPRKRVGLYVALFFLGSATMSIGELPRILPSSLNFLFMVFPVMGGSVEAQQSSTAVGAVGNFSRISGLSTLGMGLFSTLLACYGIRGLFLESGKPWRIPVFAACALVALLGGFRSALIIMFMTFMMLFHLERLYHTRLLPLLVISALLGGTLVVAFANRLPFYVQRSMAFLPIDIDPVARLSAEASSAWRVQMWKEILPLVPQYLLLGKGYGFSAREMEMVQDDAGRGGSGLVGTEMAGDYHNGPLSVLIPFGIFGMIGFLWFLFAGLRVIYQNYQFGDPAYRRFNTFIFVVFTVKFIFFFVVFGGFPTELMVFTGLVGVSVSLNGGVAKPVVVPQPKVVFNRFRLHPSVRRPMGA
jgi:hypothetical protein